MKTTTTFIILVAAMLSFSACKKCQTCNDVQQIERFVQTGSGIWVTQGDSSSLAVIEACGSGEIKEAEGLSDETLFSTRLNSRKWKVIIHHTVTCK